MVSREVLSVRAADHSIIEMRNEPDDSQAVDYHLLRARDPDTRTRQEAGSRRNP